MDADSGIDKYLLGDRIYGDEFDAAETEAWYRDEEQGYAELGAKGKTGYQYVYHALNKILGYAYLEKEAYRHVLGFGSAYGDELEPVARKTKRISIVDPGNYFQVEHIMGTPVTYYSRGDRGRLALDNESVDLITCFGVLHHIPNVSETVQEMYRCLEKGGDLLIREPIVSMGDWRKPRFGLTRRERGLPFGKFGDVLEASGFEIRQRNLFGFMPVVRLARLVSNAPYNSRYFTWLDKTVAGWFAWNYRYHRVSLFARFAPTSCFWVLRKP